MSWCNTRNQPTNVGLPYYDVEDEKSAKGWIRAWIYADERVANWKLYDEVKVGDGRIDLMVEAPFPAGIIKFGIEVKRQLYEAQLTMTKMADYLEQAASYADQLRLPVFLGPIISSARTGSDFWQGGTTASALTAFNIYGGRRNVGVMVWLATRRRFVFVLRGAYFWVPDEIAKGYAETAGFNVNRMSFATSSGSKRIREPLVLPAPASIQADCARIGDE
tara:strand:- start:3 stop:662 length:660 start_codon:yes stop_codon:yes gene_type:complete